MGILKIEDKLFRIWYYFRIGYATYVSFILGLFSFITTTYYLAINNIPFLSTAFPNIVMYALFLALIFPPLSTIIGWMHMKRTLAYTSQVTIGVEASPYSYKMQPGVSTHVGWPNILLNLEFIEIMLETSGKLTPERKKNIDHLISQVEHLLAGGSIGLPGDLRLTKLKDIKEGDES